MRSDEEEGEDRRPQRRPADVAERRFVFATLDENEEHAHQRQESDERKNGPAHQCALPNMNQVMRAATPIIMAKA